MKALLGKAGRGDGGRKEGDEARAEEENEDGDNGAAAVAGGRGVE